MANIGDFVVVLYILRSQNLEFSNYIALLHKPNPCPDPASANTELKATEFWVAPCFIIKDAFRNAFSDWNERLN